MSLSLTTSGDIVQNYATFWTMTAAQEKLDRRRPSNARSMPQREASVAFKALRAAILELDDADRARLLRWMTRYVNRWGQIPALASDRASSNVRPAWGAASSATRIEEKKG